MKKSLFLLLILLVTGTGLSMAQDTLTHYSLPHENRSRPRLKDRLFFGGDLGLQFGDVTYVNVAPTIGYKVTERFGVGVGPMYSYLKYTDYPVSFNSYGGRFFSQYKLLENILGYGEFGFLNSDVYDIVNDKVVRADIPSLLLGGAYVQELGANSSFNLMLLYNVIEDQYSYYQNPIIRLGFNAGF